MEENVMLPIPHTSLYVGDLHPSVDERMLCDKFGQIGAISHARVCRDITTKISLGYAYVNYVDPKDAERALQVMNYELLNNRPIRLMWSQRDPSLRKSGKGNVYIKNLPKRVDQRELFDTFESFGTILSCKIATDEKNVSKGFGYIHFEAEESAERAINAVNGMSIYDQIVYVGYFIPRGARKSEAGRAQFNNIYVKSFPPETTDESLRDMFAEFGEIQSCCVSVDSEGKSKGFGFVCFHNPSDAEAAVKAMHGKDVSGRQLYVNRAQRKEERQEELKQRLEKQKQERQSKFTSGVNLYVKNLDDTIDDAALEEAFSSYGSITSAKVMRDSQGRSRGFGFVCFHLAEEATKAIVEMGNFLLGTKPLYVALAQRKDERRQNMLKSLNDRMSQASRYGVPSIMQTPTPGYFQPAVYQRAPYYQQPMVGSQPRWNRPTGMPTLGVQPRPMAANYLGPNPGAVPANYAQLAQMRATGNFPRHMMQNGMQNVPPMVSHGMMAGNPSQPREVGTRQVPQYMAPNGPNMATIVANGAPNVRMVQPRPSQPSVINAGNRFNQAARSASNQANQSAGPTSVLSPLGDQIPARSGPQVAMVKSELGERLFPLVNELEPNRGAKITGMLLGLEVPEIMHLLDSKEALEARLKEAIGVLDGGAAKTDAEETSGAQNQSSDQGADAVLPNRGDVNGSAADAPRKE